MPGLLIALAVLAAATVAGLVLRSRSGRLRAPAPVELPAGLLPAGLLPELPESSGQADQVTLLQFSSATCVPCRQVRAVCADLAGGLAGVRHVELDAEDHLDAARVLNIWRLPTLLVVDRRGQVARRTVGVPDRAELRAALTEVLAA